MIADNTLATSIWTRVKTLGWRRASGEIMQSGNGRKPMTLRGLQEKKGNAENVTENRYLLILQCVNLHCYGNERRSKYICKLIEMRKNTSVALDIVTKKLPNEFLTPSKKLGSGSKPTPYPNLNVLQSIQMMLILLLDPERRGGIYSLMEPKSYLLLPTLKKKSILI